MTKEETIMLHAYAIATHTTNQYVILKEDENGRYIEYAFCKGEPHDNRCLSWYDKLQPNALERNHHDITKWKLKPVGEIYRLSSMCCGCEDRENEHERCTPGHPAPVCFEDGHWLSRGLWSYDEPVKCACWILEPVVIKNLSLKLNEAADFSREFQRLTDEAAAVAGKEVK